MFESNFSKVDKQNVYMV